MQAVRLTPARRIRWNSLAPAPTMRLSYPPDSATAAHQSGGRANVRARYTSGGSIRAWYRISYATTPARRAQVTSTTAASVRYRLTQTDAARALREPAACVRPRLPAIADRDTTPPPIPHWLTARAHLPRIHAEVAGYLRTQVIVRQKPWAA